MRSAIAYLCENLLGVFAALRETLVYLCLMQFIGNPEDTIVAPATPPGVSAIAVIRLSGTDAISIANKIFPGKDLVKQSSHTIHFGRIVDPGPGDVLDEVVVSLFKAPRSYTKEDSVEISTHGSPFIVQKIIKTLIKAGARMAQPGEFTKRAFLNGQMDLAQAEAVADLIHSDSESSHIAAINQMRGGFSKEIQKLREELIHFASMIELELDFSEEDVEFASREKLVELVSRLLNTVNPLITSFDLGNVIKNGVPTVIAGKPNAGKSTLLNLLLNEDRAIVSDIPGTTRDSIEDEISIGGVQFRFIDTAGLRETTDTVEALGVARTKQKMEEASLLLYMFDLAAEPLEEILKKVQELEDSGTPFIAIGNKADKASREVLNEFRAIEGSLSLTASTGEGLEPIKEAVLQKIHFHEVKKGDVIVTNIRHYENLLRAKAALEDVMSGVEKEITNDFLAMELRHALTALSEITGDEITTEDLLENIFSKFCIGK